MPNVDFLDDLIINFDAPDFGFVTGMSVINDVLDQVDNFGGYLSKLSTTCLKTLIELVISIDYLDPGSAKHVKYLETLLKKNCPGNNFSFCA